MFTTFILLLNKGNLSMLEERINVWNFAYVVLQSLMFINLFLTRNVSTAAIPDVVGDNPPGRLGLLLVLDDVVLDGTAPVRPAVEVEGDEGGVEADHLG